jgi:hypothetical protein
MHCARGSDNVTKDDALLYLKILSRHFGVPVPKLAWSDHRSRGYYSHGGIVRLGPKAWVSGEATLVHEFSHHLTAHRHGYRVHHQRPFCEALEQVAREFYGHAKLYPWSKDYQSVASYARKCGLLETAKAAAVSP